MLIADQVRDYGEEAIPVGVPDFFGGRQRSRALIEAALERYERDGDTGTIDAIIIRDNRVDKNKSAAYPYLFRTAMIRNYSDAADLVMERVLFPMDIIIDSIDADFSVHESFEGDYDALSSSAYVGPA